MRCKAYDAKRTDSDQHRDIGRGKCDMRLAAQAKPISFARPRAPWYPPAKAGKHGAAHSRQVNAGFLYTRSLGKSGEGGTINRFSGVSAAL